MGRWEHREIGTGFVAVGDHHGWCLSMYYTTSNVETVCKPLQELATAVSGSLNSVVATILEKCG